MLDKKQLINLLNKEGALWIWHSSSQDNILTKHYNYLWENTKQIKKNAIQKCITFQENYQNDKGEYNTFDVIINQTKNKKGIIHNIVDIVQY